MAGLFADWAEVGLDHHAGRRVLSSRASARRTGLPQRIAPMAFSIKVERNPQSPPE
jgi:hypothetical protein